MNFKYRIFAGLLLGIAGLSVVCGAAELAGEPEGQSFSDSSASAGMGGGASVSVTAAATPAVADTPDSNLFADGTRAINESRWADAAKIFATIAEQHGEHADGALYWKAYAEDKLGQSKLAQQTCEELRKGFPESRWIDDCGALEVEIRAKMGKRVEIEPGQSDDVKLLALNAMMHQDEPRALAEIQSILNGDASDRLKKEAQFILGQHYSDVTYAQIVRISYLEGDVRIERGDGNAKASSDPWEKAVVDLPLKTGFSLVTGAGRAEIEFENASTLYLGENSVLSFNDLHETAGVPYTELALLSGMVSLHIHPYVAGEDFILHTPTNDFVARYPDKSDARIESFTDGVKITPLQGWGLRLPGIPKDEMEPGRTWTYKPGQLWAEKDTADKEASAESEAWDKWVSDRVAKREAAIASVMEASGLPAPIPGMAEMAGQGKFFECAPYGTCWEPKDIANEDGEMAGRQPEAQPNPIARNGQAHLMFSSYHPNGTPGWPVQDGLTPPPRVLLHEMDFPCTPGSLRYRTVKDPVTGRRTVVDSGMGQTQVYDWAVCHAGTWIRHKKHYAWVSGCKRHHIDPVRWVKSGHRIAFVPLHPYDVKGQPAINARHEVFEVTGKGEIAVHPVKFEPNILIEYLKEAPKEYRNEPMRPLAHVEAPRMEARALVKGPQGKGAEMGKTVIPIHFDTKSRSFMMPHAEMRGGKTTTAFAPMTNHTGSLQARGGSVGGGSGFHGASGGSSGGSHGSASGGGSHAGSSGASGGGGGSHGGGSSGSSSSGAASSSSGGGSHH